MKSNEQQLRIFKAPTSQNIAVSAGAGTGKSTTLKNKVIDLIQRRVYKPSEFLIVTFTKDAANSLKNKIKLGIREKPGCEDLISEVDSMHIDTLDAFRLFIVKKYALSIGLTGDVGVLDNDIMLLEEYKILDRLLDTYYVNNDQTIIELVNDFLVKDDGNIKTLIIEIANSLEVTNKTKEEVVNEYKAKYLNKEIINAHIEEYLTKYYKTLKDMVNNMYLLLESADLTDDGDIQPNVIKLQEKYEKLFNAVTPKELSDGYKYYKSISKTLSSKKSFTQYEEIKKLNDKINKFKDIYVELDKRSKDFEYDNKYIPFLVGIAYDVKKEIDKFMMDKGVYRFSDLSKLALKVLENEEVLEEIKSSFKMIMIDEYQDNSDEDDAFFTKISSDNLFLVGDVKQSIYGFKGANPGKFTAKYEDYSKDNALKNPSDPNPYTMNINYRSRKEILDGVNDIFDNFMDLKCGGVNYKDNHALKYEANLLYDNAPQPESKDKGLTKMIVGDAENLVARLNSLVGENRFSEDDIKKNTYLASVALSILDRINKGAKVASTRKDKDGNNIYELRNATYKDFAVLTRNNVDSEICRNIFNSLGIPVNIVADERITEDTMVVTLKSFINLINHLINDDGENIKVNDKYIYVRSHEKEIKHYFASIFRSFVINGSDQDLYDLVGDTTYDENHKLITNYAYKESPLYKSLEEFALNHKSSSLKELVIDIVNEFNFVKALSRLGNAVSSIQKLTMLIEKISAMDKIGYQLSDLFYYFKNMDKLNLSFDVRLGNDSNNAVTIETFHKSKGLEFPIIYIECTNDMVSSRNRSNVMEKGRSSSYYGNVKTGFFLPRKTYSGNEPKHTFIKEYAKMIEDKETLSEETRLFYVALTRAKEVAILVCQNKEEPLDRSNKDNVKTYADIVEYSGFKIKDDEYSFGDKKLDSISQKPIDVKVQCLDNGVKYELVDSKTHHPSIKEELGVSSYILKKGIRYHAYMQYADFVSKDTSFIKSSADRTNINKVLSLDIFKNLENAKVYKEYNYYDEEIDENGIIDLLIDYGDHCLVVDYKLKHADEDKYDAQLKAYKAYVEKTFKKPTETILISLLGN